MVSSDSQTTKTASSECFQQENEQVSILGVKVSNFSLDYAINLIERFISKNFSCTHVIYIVNTHTLNLAAEDPEYRDTLNSADKIFADGTGVRWAAAQRGVRMKANLVGTDLIPQLFEGKAGRGFRYFLLGADKRTIECAANNCTRMHQGWELAGYHHGFLSRKETPEVIQQINAVQPHLLLVGMGNPKQEQWIREHKGMLRAHLAIGVGGLFDHWGGNLVRAPRWVRHMGFEWLQILLQQPNKKWRRYLLGNPKFLWRITHHKHSDMRK